MAKKNWKEAFDNLIAAYQGRRHPLEYKNIYQLLVMVVLSAQDSDKNINALAPEFFKAFPTIKRLSQATPEELLPFVKKVRGHRKKIDWLLEIAGELKADKNIPLTMDALVKLKGIGRKSANVIMREAGIQTEGIMVDLHVVRVAPRLGITKSEDPKKIEQDLMAALPEEQWTEAGMALSFLGRETCRPSHPEHAQCVMTEYCDYFKKHKNKVTPGERAVQEKKQAAKKVLTGKAASQRKKE